MEGEKQHRRITYNVTLKCISSLGHRSVFVAMYRVTQKKRELFEKPTKIEEIQEKKLLRENEPLQLAF